MLPDPYPVQPWTQPCRGEVKLPGSKSLTNRSLVLAALSNGRIRLKRALFSRDSAILCSCLRELGFDVVEDENALEIVLEGHGGQIPRDAARLFVGNAGTAARFLTAMVCLHPSGTYHMDGDPEMRRRPMSGLIRTLKSLGAQFNFEGKADCFPFTVRTSGLAAGEWTVDASASSQMLSALLMIAPCLGSDVRIVASGARPAFVNMTACLMSGCGIDVAGNPEEGYLIPGGQAYRIDGGMLEIEPDVSAASYFMALPYVVGGRIRINGLREGMLQGDLAFADVLKAIGMEYEQDASGWTVRYGTQPANRPAAFDFNTFSDTFLTFAAIAPLLDRPVRIDGIGHTRFQETDRIAAMAQGLRKTGAEVQAGESAMLIRPFARLQDEFLESAAISTFHDHRVAMSFAILGCRSRRPSGRPWLHVFDPGCCSKTFPGFFIELESLYRFSHDTGK